MKNTILIFFGFFIMGCGSDKQISPEKVEPSSNNVYWVNNEWKNSGFKRLWEGCIGTAYVASGYRDKHGMLTGIEIRDSNDPVLVDIKNYCHCQTKFFQDRYELGELKEIIVDRTTEVSKKALDELFSQCGTLNYSK